MPGTQPRHRLLHHTIVFLRLRSLQAVLFPASVPEPPCAPGTSPHFRQHLHISTCIRFAAQVTPTTTPGTVPGIFPPPISVQANPEALTARKSACVLIHGHFQTNMCKHWLCLQETNTSCARARAEPAHRTSANARTRPPSPRTGSCESHAILMAV